MNKIFISGNLTRDPEVRYTSGGKSYARMGIAVNRRPSKNASSDAPTVDFFNITAWNKTAEFCGKYLRKGSKVFVEGMLTTSNYEGKDGVKRSSIDIWVSSIEFAGNKSADSNNNQLSYNNNEPKNNSAEEFDSGFSGENVSEEDVPF